MEAGIAIAIPACVCGSKSWFVGTVSTRQVVPVVDSTDYQDSPPLGTLKDPSGGRQVLLARLPGSTGIWQRHFSSAHRQ